MSATHADNAPANAAMGGCLECSNPNDVLVFDSAVVDDETGAGGQLVLCAGCVISAAEVALAVRAKRAGVEEEERPWWVHFDTPEDAASSLGS